MKVIDLNKQIGISFLLYPDNQPHINISGIVEGDEVNVTCSIITAQTLIHLLQCSNALDNLFAKKKVLTIPYFNGEALAQADRFNGGDFHMEVSSTAPGTAKGGDGSHPPLRKSESDGNRASPPRSG